MLYFLSWRGFCPDGVDRLDVGADVRKVVIMIMVTITSNKRCAEGKEETWCHMPSSQQFCCGGTDVPRRIADI